MASKNSEVVRVLTNARARQSRAREVVKVLTTARAYELRVPATVNTFTTPFFFRGPPRSADGPQGCVSSPRTSGERGQPLVGAFEMAGFSQPRCFLRSCGKSASSIWESRAGAVAARGAATSSRSFARSTAVA